MAAVDRNELEGAMIMLDETSDDAQAWVSRATGEIHIRYPEYDVPAYAAPLPDDIDDEERYVAIPRKRSLDLGKSLALRFAKEHLRSHEATVKGFFRQSGAYSRFSGLLASLNKSDAWHRYRDEATLAALSEWCEENGLSLKA
jgi:hypothetical protein